jgi:hypothetical protein
VAYNNAVQRPTEPDGVATSSIKPISSRDDRTQPTCLGLGFSRSVHSPLVRLAVLGQQLPQQLVRRGVPPDTYD